MKTPSIWIILAAVVCGAFAHARPQPEPADATAQRARVVIVGSAEATEAYKPAPETVAKMVTRGILALSNTADATAAWKTFVSPSDKIGIKVYSVPGALSGTRLPVAEAVVRGLLGAGVPATNIILWDKHAIDLRLAGFNDLASRLGIQVASSLDAGYDYQVFYDSPILGNLVWGDFDFGKSAEGLGRKSYVSRLVARDLTKIINITPLLNHNVAGVTGNLYSLAMGAVDNSARFEYDQQRLAQAVPEIFALPEIGDKVVLNITDALICQYEGGERALLHYSVTPNELWFSKDPVALDALALAQIVKERDRNVGSTLKPNRELYSNASLLELGVSDTNRVDIQKLTIPPN